MTTGKAPEPVIEFVAVRDWPLVLFALIIGGVGTAALLWALASYQRRNDGA